MKQYDAIEKRISNLQEQEDRIKGEMQTIINHLKDDNVHLDMELQTTNRKLNRKISELSELKDSFEKLQQEYFFLSPLTNTSYRQIVIHRFHQRANIIFCLFCTLLFVATF